MFAFGRFGAGVAVRCPVGVVPFREVQPVSADLRRGSGRSRKGSEMSRKGSDKSRKGSEMSIKGSGRSRKGSEMSRKGSEKSRKGSEMSIKGSGRSRKGSQCRTQSLKMHATSTFPSETPIKRGGGGVQQMAALAVARQDTLLPIGPPSGMWISC